MDFTAPSADQGLYFHISAQGHWCAKKGHHDPGAAAAVHIIDEVTRLAAACPVLVPAALQYRANAQLGHPTHLADCQVRLDWATIQVHVDPDDACTAHQRARLAARQQAEWETRQLRMSQALTYRDHLRQDPTLVLAQLLLDAPQTITEQTIALIPKIAEQVAAHAPGATWVHTARLLDTWFRGLAPDAKEFIIARLCTVATQFGYEDLAEQVKSAHQTASGSGPGDT